MLISTGKVPQSEPWRILEVAIGQAPDVIALRISKELKRLHCAAEALIPFTPNAAGTPEWIVEHVYVRGLNGQLSKVAQAPGIDFIRQEIAPHAWISTLMLTEPQHEIGTQSFVRLLAGPCARMCGHVSRIANGTVSVAVAMKTKKLTVHTLLSNVQPVECPPDKQSFFFAD